MPATPAWPPESAPRLFVDVRLESGLSLPISGGQAHYLLSVMRMREGKVIKLCDNQTGEWLGTISMVGKRDLIVSVEGQLRSKEEVPDLWLLVAPIKKARIDFMIEKATELGVAVVKPVLTQRTVVDRLNLDRLRAHMVEAAEQCGRTALPVLEEPTKLAKILADWPDERALYFADEQGGAPFAQITKHHKGPAAILIGPEGGFSDEEREAILAIPQAVGVSLGPRILRAETASLAAISIWMSAQGDWA